jgi:pimeloyl-ACP methyl ester carboxylesterase
MRAAALILCVYGLGGCGKDNPPSRVDSGFLEADAGATDAGATDGGVDAGVPDAGIDAGTLDAGQPHLVGCVTSLSAGHHSFGCSGITYEVEIPAACTGGGCGVVFDIHGATMNATSQDKSTGLRALGKAAGYVVVQPSAPLTLIGNSWTPSTDDPKVWTFTQQLLQALAIDSRRIHFTGFSQGGAMTWRMLCAHADVIASAAPIAAADGQSLTSTSPPFTIDCPFDSSKSPSAQLPILQMHGTADGLVPFGKATQQRDAVIAQWGLGPPSVVTSDAKHTHTRFTNPSGAVYEFLQHDYVVPPPLVLVPLQGHCIPGGADLPANATLGQTAFFSCAPPNAFVWGPRVLKFFIDHPRL